MSDKYMTPVLTAAAVFLVLYCAIGFHSARATNSQDSTAIEAPAEALKTVSFDVPGMTCVTCPYTVKKTLKKIDGVTKADSSFETKSATATFDPAKTSIDVMLEALKNQGYPSTVAEEPCEDKETPKC